MTERSARGPQAVPEQKDSEMAPFSALSFGRQLAQEAGVLDWTLATRGLTVTGLLLATEN